MKIFRNLFRRKSAHEPYPEIVIEKKVSEYLSNLPRCNKDVIIVSPKYRKNSYTCEIFVSSKDLLSWARPHSKDVWSADQEEQAARKALPLWLNSADNSNNTASYVPHFMFEVLEPYILNFVNNGTARIFCMECQAFADHVEMEKTNEKSSGNWGWWTDLWKCSQGHQLYYEEHEIHVNVRR